MGIHPSVLVAIEEVNSESLTVGLHVCPSSTFEFSLVPLYYPTH